MADQGAIGVTHAATYHSPCPLPNGAVASLCHALLTASRKIPLWRAVPYSLSSVTSAAPPLFLPVGGVLSGVVQTSGVADAGYTVRLYHRPSGQKIDETHTDSAGAFSFSTCLDSADTGNYFVVAHDLAGGFNAVIIDLLTPV